MRKTRFMYKLDEKFGEPIEELLKRLYLKERKNGIQISKELGIKWSTVYKLLRWFGIPCRSMSEIRMGRKHSKETRKKMSNAQKGRKITWGNKISKAMKGKKQSEEHIKHSSEGRKGLIPWNKGQKGVQKSTRKGKTFEDIYGSKRSKEIRKKQSETRLKDREKYRKLAKERWKNPQYAKKILKSLFQKPNKLETKLVRIIKKNAFPFRYVGDGQMVIDGKVPDFIATNGSKKIIELFGRPWHDPKNKYHSPKIEYDRTEEGRHKFYESHSYELLVIWDDELKDESKVVEKIRAFAGKHVELYEEVLNCPKT